ncbi:carboxy terminal-processing peptidase [Desulfofustis limnaeus]|uniref:Tail-specific protease n=1 Tax=Desulfofustis limnaeus TaxID=2740163 RepID=A0ABM7WAR1_9BACT|nr:carboxy terminal-processing peptidase [Desulfofustis limnaeus]BDD88035.1 tail-specific protease [Desulfofustis limnaeus]
MKIRIYPLHLVVVLVSLLLLIVAGLATGGDQIGEKRNKLIGYMLGKQLPSIHFSDKEMNDQLSLAAFDLYLKQLDFQKRFLLREDVDELRAYADKIDDNLINGSIILPETGYVILNERVRQVEAMVETLMSGRLDPEEPETFESDPEKLDFCLDSRELEERWRLILTFQVLTRYLDLEEQQKSDGLSVDPEALWQESRERVKKRFANFFHRLHQETLQDHYDRYFNAVARAFDPHTNYMAPDSKEDFDIHMRGSLEGIGALLREEDGYIKVVRIIPGSASARQGRLQAEDIIQAVAEGEEEPVEITDMRLRDAVRLIRGPKGSEVRLTVRKSDGTKDIIPIVRDVVQIEETFVKHAVINAAGHRFGYIRIPSFYRDFENNGEQEQGRNSTDDTRNAIVELKNQGIEGIILDLRDNGGGSLVDAVDITGLFINSGPVVQVKNSYGLKRVLEDEDSTLDYGGPLVVLVNQFSASASEIVAAALQDYRRAVIVGGKHTHGKGTVQTIVDLNENIPLFHLRRYEDLGALKATIQKFYRVNGGSTQYRGVEPDIILPSLFQHLESGEQYLDYSLPWDQEEPAAYQSYADMVPDLATIVQRSRERVAASEGLRLIEEEAQRSALRSEQTVLTLDLDSMRSRREEERQARDRVGAHYQRLEEERQLVGEETGDDRLSDGQEEDAGDWLESLDTDPYIGEARMILRDLAVLPTP